MFGRNDWFVSTALIVGVISMGGCQSPGRSAASSTRIASPPVRTEIGRKSIPAPAPRIAEKPDYSTRPSAEPGQFSIPQEPAPLQQEREDVVPLPNDLEEPPAREAAADRGFVAQISHEVVQGRELQPIGSGIFNSYRTNVAPRPYQPRATPKPQQTKAAPKPREVAVPAYARPVVQQRKIVNDSNHSFVTLGAPEFIIEMKSGQQPVPVPQQLPIKAVSQTRSIPQTLQESNESSLPGWNEVMQPNGKLPASVRPTGIQSQHQRSKAALTPQQKLSNSWKSWTGRILKTK